MPKLNLWLPWPPALNLSSGGMGCSLSQNILPDAGCRHWAWLRTSPEKSECECHQATKSVRTSSQDNEGQGDSPR